MSANPQRAGGCGAALIGLALSTALGWGVASLLPVRCDWQYVNQFETAQATVLGVPVASGSGPRGVHRQVIREAHQTKLAVVVGLAALLGAASGWAVGRARSGDEAAPDVPG